MQQQFWVVLHIPQRANTTIEFILNYINRKFPKAKAIEGKGMRKTPNKLFIKLKVPHPNNLLAIMKALPGDKVEKFHFWN